LVLARDPIVKIRQTAHRVVTPAFCEKIYKHAGYSCPFLVDFYHGLADSPNNNDYNYFFDADNTSNKIPLGLVHKDSPEI
jgi:hypothetical protein